MKPTSDTLASLHESDLRRLLAELGHGALAYRFRVAPNPTVGAAVLSDGVEIGRGFHTTWGGPHAEVHALEAAAASGVPPERWDTMVITLEPCSSQGKTGACTRRLLDVGIRRVIVGALDPDPRHEGRGLNQLEAAGVEVVHLRGASPLGRFAPHFYRWTLPDRQRRGRPWLIAKWAQTRTGQLQAPESHGRWISSPPSLAEVHRLRASCDAVITGIGTVLRDDPRLSVRGEAARGLARDEGPQRVIVDSDLRTPLEARIFAATPEGEAAGEVVIVCRGGAHPRSHRALKENGVRVEVVGLDDKGRVNVREMLNRMWNAGMRRVLLEAGTTLATSFLEHDLVDQLLVYTGAVNGGEGEPLSEWLRPDRLRLPAHRESGDDAVLEAFLGGDFPR
ncbi:MAG: bifunctional diaminohydroxyphosphoribosylaminopyrimidine deaminase/5-amino-6-(5-phosphoribosylamino)uracil reductase RibD [Planctomycetota bacterium]